MGKTYIILKREYLTRVRKKSFIITTLLVPIFMVAIMVVPAWLATRDDTQERTIAVYDESGLFLGKLDEQGYTKYHFVDEEIYQRVRENLGASEFYALLYIPGNIYTTHRAQLSSPKQVPFELASQIERRLGQLIEADKRAKVIDDTGIPDLEEKLSATRTRISVSTMKVTDRGEERKSSSMVAFIASYAMGFIIYFFVFMYGTMVMRSVMEEKKNRIVEVIISSVKPFELMSGKIIGTAMVGLTQVAIWVILGLAGLSIARGFLTPDSAQEMSQSLLQAQPQMGAMQPDMLQAEDNIAEVIEMITNLNLPLIIFAFIFYFLGGYLLYSSLMGAIGAAVDNDEDSQQLIFPVTFPLILSIILLFSISKNPEGSVAFWASIIPFTSPICMLARIPYGVPAWELLLSIFLLIVTLVGVIWIAAKIYRTGILMYGKKVTIKELYKWLTYKG
jgi:ABC-2 type transport system permease protein